MVVVAFGAPDLLLQALRPLAALDVVVVDNSSRVDVRAVCRTTGVRYVDPGRNLGFAGGVNLGVRTLGVDGDVLVLNPDAIVQASDLDRMLTVLHADRHTAAVAPRLVGPDGEQRASWPWPSPGHMWQEAVGLGRVADRHDFLVGAVLLLSGQALAEVGTFDERFFLYAEETDWQRRAVDLGWQVKVVPEVVAVHTGAGTSTDGARRQALFHAGTETYIRKWFGPRGWLSYRAAAVVGAAARSLLPGPRGSAARRRVVLYTRGPRRAAGFDV